MSAGLPVVGTNWGGLKDTIRNGVNGYLIDTWMTDWGVRADAGQLLQACERLLRSGALRMRMAQASRRIATDEYGLPAFRRRLLDSASFCLESRKTETPTAPNRFTPFGRRYDRSMRNKGAIRYARSDYDLYEKFCCSPTAPVEISIRSARTTSSRAAHSLVVNRRGVEVRDPLWPGSPPHQRSRAPAAEQAHAKLAPLLEGGRAGKWRWPLERLPRVATADAPGRRRSNQLRLGRIPRCFGSVRWPIEPAPCSASRFLPQKRRRGSIVSFCDCEITGAPWTMGARPSRSEPHRIRPAMTTRTAPPRRTPCWSANSVGLTTGRWLRWCDLAVQHTRRPFRHELTFGWPRFQDPSLVNYASRDPRGHPRGAHWDRNFLKMNWNPPLSGELRARYLFELHAAHRATVRRLGPARVGNADQRGSVGLRRRNGNTPMGRDCRAHEKRYRALISPVRSGKAHRALGPPGASSAALE